MLGDALELFCFSPAFVCREMRKLQSRGCQGDPIYTVEANGRFHDVAVFFARHHAIINPAW